jgi:hypothetical protein
MKTKPVVKPHAIKKTYAGPKGPTCGVCHQPVGWRGTSLIHK